MDNKLTILLETLNHCMKCKHFTIELNMVMDTISPYPEMSALCCKHDNVSWDSNLQPDENSDAIDVPYNMTCLEWWCPLAKLKDDSQ